MDLKDMPSRPLVLMPSMSRHTHDIQSPPLHTRPTTFVAGGQDARVCEAADLRAWETAELWPRSHGFQQIGQAAAAVLITQVANPQ